MVILAVEIKKNTLRKKEKNSLIGASPKAVQKISTKAANIEIYSAKVEV
jgi:hypothetical protein